MNFDNNVITLCLIFIWICSNKGSQFSILIAKLLSYRYKNLSLVFIYNTIEYVAVTRGVISVDSKVRIKVANPYLINIIIITTDSNIPIKVTTA